MAYFQTNSINVSTEIKKYSINFDHAHCSLLTCTCYINMRIAYFTIWFSLRRGILSTLTNPIDCKCKSVERMKNYFSHNCILMLIQSTCFYSINSVLLCTIIGFNYPLSYKQIDVIK